MVDPFAPPGSSPEPPGGWSTGTPSPSSPGPTGPTHGTPPPPPPPGPGAFGGPPPPPPPGARAGGTNGWAIASLVTSIVGVICLSPIFGIVALRQIKRTGQGGRGLAIAGLVVSGCWLAFIALIVGVTVLGEAERDETGTIVDGGDLDVEQLRVGDCIDDVEESEVVFSIPVVPCDEPHGAEVYAVFELPAGDYPGDDAVIAGADEGCFDRLETFSQSAFDDPSVEIFYYYPTGSTWRLGDREVVCIADFAGGPRTGSLRPG